MIDRSTAFDTLVQDLRAHYGAHGFDIDMQLDPKEGAFYLVTPIFKGDGFIPPSVCEALNAETLILTDEQTKIEIILDDKRFLILLLYKRRCEAITLALFQEALDEFFALAEEWRWLLDQYGERDHALIPRSP